MLDPRRLCIPVLLLALLSASCSTAEITTGDGECVEHSQCAKDELCQKGKCVRQDDDGDGWAKAEGKDCDDRNKYVNPGRPEVCGNKADDNCNGKVDEQPCECESGAVKSCQGPEEGVCKPGLKRCVQGTWSDKCEGQVLPSKEDCNAKDDDCNGKVDDGLSAQCYGGPAGTGGKGECKIGTRECKDGKWSGCKGEAVPKPEACNNLDDDCNGKIDDGLQQACYTGPAGTEGRGRCQPGVKECRAGSWAGCVGQVTPTPEDCNGLDDNCDGKVDEGLGGECYTGPAATKGVGQCKPGRRTCDAGKWTQCVGQVLPAGSENCKDNLDNNCNGQLNEGCTSAFEIEKSINTDTGKVDGIVPPGWDGLTASFTFPTLRIPTGKRVKVTGSRPLKIKVTGSVWIVGTLDMGGTDGGSSNCSTSAAGVGGAGGGGGGGRGGSGGVCKWMPGETHPTAGSGTGSGPGKGGRPGQGSGSGGGGGGGGHSAVGGTALPAGLGGKGGIPYGSTKTQTAGSGGGGGACGSMGSSFLGVYTPGAGGGGGGGAVQIESTGGSISVEGNIIVAGGDGGHAPECPGGPGKATGGGGGGGSGGVIFLRAKGQVTIASTSWLNGAGGKGAGMGVAKGGNGSIGRILFADSDGKVSYPSGRVVPAATVVKY